MANTDTIALSQIGTQYFTEVEMTQLGKWTLQDAKNAQDVWGKLPDSIKRIINAIWEVEKYCHDIVNPLDEKHNLMEGSLGNMPNIRYLLDTNTNFSDQEKDAIAGKDTNQIFYGWEGWNRYWTDNEVITLSRSHFESSSSSNTIAEVQRRFSYIIVK